jgi:hypothetical protein
MNKPRQIQQDRSLSLFFVLACAPISVVFALLSMISSCILMTWSYLPTRGSVLIIALFHGLLNIAPSIVAAGIYPAYFNVLYSSGFVIAALIVVLMTGQDLRRQATEAAIEVNQQVTEQS